MEKACSGVLQLSQHILSSRIVGFGVCSDTFRDTGGKLRLHETSSSVIYGGGLVLHAANRRPDASQGVRGSLWWAVVACGGKELSSSVSESVNDKSEVVCSVIFASSELNDFRPPQHHKCGGVDLR